MLGYNKSLFQDVGKPCISLTLLEEKRMQGLIDDLPSYSKLTLKKQRALKKTANEAIALKREEYKKLAVFKVLQTFVFPGCFKYIQTQIDK